MDELIDVRGISDIAYGFIGSKALFTALNMGLFEQLANEPQTLETLSQATAVSSNHLLKLLTACCTLGLIVKEDKRYRNAEASQKYLVRTAKDYFGDYFRYQIERQIYPWLLQLAQVLRWQNVEPFYEMVSTDSEEARNFIQAQHVGSLGPAHIIAKRIDIADARNLLDVAGGSGALTITLCQQYPLLNATILDFQNIIAHAQQYVEEAKLNGRISFLAGNALEVKWPQEQDIILLSYLFSAVDQKDIEELVMRANHSLVLGGKLFVHDFMVEDDYSGPKTAALLSLASTFTQDSRLLTPSWLTELVHRNNFSNIFCTNIIPGITKFLVAEKVA